MPNQTLEQKIEQYFSRLSRPYTGRLFIDEYRNLYKGAGDFLAKPYPEAVTGQSLFKVAGQFPIGRVLSPADVGLYDAAIGQRPPLSDSVSHWLTEFRHDTPVLVGALLARAFAPTELGEHAAAFARELSDGLAANSRHLSFDYAGIVRVAVLLAAHFGEPMVSVRSLGRAALLLLDRETWQILRLILEARAVAWDALESTYLAVRDRVLEADPCAHDRLLSAGLFPRDQLIPLPSSLRLQELQLLGQGLAFAWPGRRVGPGYGPLESAPESLTDACLLSHVLLPGLQRHGIGVPFKLSTKAPQSLPTAVGTTVAAGGWALVLARVVARYEFESAITGAGFSAKKLVEWACSTQPSTPPLADMPSRIADSTNSGARCLKMGADSLSTAVETAEATNPTEPEGIGFAQLCARLLSQGFDAHRDAVRELALIVDPRAHGLGPARVLMIGPSGCGKTSLVDAFARATGRPMVKLDAASIVEHGWQGTTPSDVAARIYAAADRDLGSASRAVVVLDEFCKTAARAHIPGAEYHGGNGNWEAVKLSRQAALLGLLDTGPSSIAFTTQPGSEPLELPVRDLVVVAAGAFSGLEYRRSIPPSDAALVRYGLHPELVARFTTRLVLGALDLDSLRQRFMAGPDGVAPVIAFASQLGVELNVSDQAVGLVLTATLSGAGGLTPRTGAAVLTTAARRSLLASLDAGESPRRSVFVGPDDVIDLLRPWIEEARKS